MLHEPGEDNHPQRNSRHEDGGKARGQRGLPDGQPAIAGEQQQDAHDGSGEPGPGARILTSAGVAAGLDLCLHIVRADHGTRIANILARRLVIPPHREGGQAQYTEQPLPIDGSPNLGPSMDWARANLELPLLVEDIARLAAMSPRTFARRFRETTGTTPLQWLCAERVRRAQDLLENTDDTIDRIADACGLGSAHGLRTHFTRINGVTPDKFRRTFRGHAAA
jgi:AraC family transcriptional activator FtrA